MLGIVKTISGGNVIALIFAATGDFLILSNVEIHLFLPSSSDLSSLTILLSIQGITVPLDECGVKSCHIKKMFVC